MSIDRDLRAINASPEVLGVVQFGGYAPPVADAMIDFLREQAATPFATEPVFSPGDWAKVLDGPFAGQAGRVVAFDAEQERVQLLLALLGNEIPVQVSARALDATSPQLRFPVPLLATADT